MRVYPVLKPARWQGLTYGARAHVWIGEPENPEVIVTYGCFDGGLLSYITNEISGYGEPDDLVKEAFANLEGHEIKIRAAGSGPDKVAVAAGPFAAEQALSERHMLAVHAELDADEIMVSIARRDTFMACRAQASTPLRRTMSKLHQESWSTEAKPTERIFEQLIVFRNGLKAETVAVDVEHPHWGRWDRE